MNKKKIHAIEIMVVSYRFTEIYFDEENGRLAIWLSVYFALFRTKFTYTSLF